MLGLLYACGRAWEQGYDNVQIWSSLSLCYGRIQLKHQFFCTALLPASNVAVVVEWGTILTQGACIKEAILTQLYAENVITDTTTCVHFPAHSFLPPWTSHSEGDGHDHWRTGLWWAIPPAGGWGWDSLPTSIVPSVGPLPGPDASSAEQLAGELPNLLALATVSLVYSRAVDVPTHEYKYCENHMSIEQ